MRKLVYGLFAVVALLAAAALVLPSLIDWNAWKPELSAKVKEVSGRTLEVRGDLNAGVLPSLHLAAHDVRLSNAPGARSADMATLRTLKVDVRLAPLLKGRIEVAGIELVQPVIELERLAGGRMNWTLEAGGMAPGPGGEGTGERAAAGFVEPDTAVRDGPEGVRERAVPGPAAAGYVRAFRLDNLSIRDGTINYRDSAKGTVESIRNLSADGALDSLAGPARLEGGMTVRGLQLAFDGSIGRHVEGTPLAFALELGTRGVSTVSVKGTVTGLGDAPRLRADVRGGGRSLRDLVAALPGSAAPQAPDHPFALAASLSATPEAITLEDLTVELGGARARGSAKVTTGRVIRADVALEADRIDADAFLPAAAPGSRTGDAPGDAGKDMVAAGGAGASGGEEVPAGAGKAVAEAGGIGASGVEPPGGEEVAAGAGKEAAEAGGIGASGAGPPGGGEVAAGAGKEAAGTGKAGEESGVRLPGGIDVRVGLAVGEIVLKGRPIREVRLDASLGEGALSLDRFSARLPGGATFGATGTASGGDGTLRYAGKLSFRAADLRTLLDRMGVDLSGMAAGGLEKATAVADVSGDLSRIRFGNVRMQLDDSRLDGSASLALGGRPAFDASLDVDRLDLDAWLPAAEAGRTGAAAVAGAAAGVTTEVTTEVTTGVATGAAAEAVAGVTTGDATGDAVPASRKEPPSERGDDPLSIPRNFDADLDVRVGSIVYREAAIRDLRFDGTLANGRLTVREASIGSLAGASARIEGIVSDVEGVPSFEGTVTAASDDPSGLFRVLRVEPPIAAGKLGPMRLSARTTAVRGGVAVDARLGLAGVEATVTGSVNDLAKTPTFDLRFDGRHPDLARLAAVLGARIRKDRAGGGPVALELSARGNLETLSVEADGALAKGTVRLSGTLDAPFDAPKLDMGLDLRHPDLAGLIRALRPGYVPAAPDLGGLALTAGLKSDGDTVVIEGLSGNVGPTDLAGNGTWRAAGPRPRLKLALTCGVIRLNDYLGSTRSPGSAEPARRPRAGTGGEGSLPAAAGAASGLEPAAEDDPKPPADPQRWPADPIDTTLPALADAEIEVHAEALIYKSFRVERPILNATLDDRILRIERLAGTVFGGGFDLAGGLDGRDVPAIDVDVAIEGMNVAEALFQASAFDVAAGTLDAGMKLHARGRSQRDLVRSLAGSADFKVRNGAVKGFDLHEVSDRLKHPGASAGFIGFLDAAMSGGVTRVSSLDATLAVENGVVRTSDMKLVADAGAGEAQGIVDLPAWNIDTHAVFRLTEHEGAPPLHLRLTGPPDAPRRRFDFAALQAWVLERGAVGLAETLAFPVPALIGAVAGETVAGGAVETVTGVAETVAGDVAETVAGGVAETVTGVAGGVAEIVTGVAGAVTGGAAPDRTRPQEASPVPRGQRKSEPGEPGDGDPAGHTGLGGFVRGLFEGR